MADPHDGSLVKRRLVCTAYFSIVVSTSSLSPCLPYLFADRSLPGSSDGIPRMLGLSSLVHLSGKALLGWLTDRCGGLPILASAMLVKMILLLLISLCSSMSAFQAFWLIESFVSSGCWGAASKFTHDNFPRSEWEAVISCIAASSGMGSIFASYTFSTLLSLGFNWRIVFRVSAFAQIIALSSVIALIRKHQTLLVSRKQIISGSASKKAQESFTRVLRRISSDARFWLMCAAKISLMIVWQFSSLIPLYLSLRYSHVEVNTRAVASAMFPVSYNPQAFGLPSYFSLGRFFGT